MHLAITYAPARGEQVVHGRPGGQAADSAPGRTACRVNTALHQRCLLFLRRILRLPLPGEPVVLTTQTANVGSMRLAEKLGFTEVDRFQAWNAEQWLGQRSPVTPSA